ncbi:uncharacterized protein FMAN_09915 [Fusarium mangiferae]|uniref:Uncharacterized protein n=1 Tax=Fusarium mangiferae TaxID=192010 RepID=A0A1L7TRD7_FUSMA|nr:uncharacterized protein FMAN_09915 [Fusarium mangiferae]CVL00489.1 uncharacterized protein FMAN_09915 [Fusarium mangiferae]
MSLQPATLSTNADKWLTYEEMVSRFKDLLKHKPSVKGKNKDEDNLWGNGLEKSQHGINETNVSLDMGEVSDCGTLDQKINGSVSNDTKGNEESNGKPKSGSKEELSHKPNDTKIPLERHDIRCFGPHQFGKHKDIYRISQQN